MPSKPRTAGQSGRRINPWRMFQGAFLPLWLLERPEISMGAKVLYAQLARNAGNKGVAWPSQKFLAERLGVKERQLRNLLAEIRDAGLVEIERRGTRMGRKGETSRYWFVEHRWITAAMNFDRQRIAGQSRIDRQEIAGQSPRRNKGSRARGGSESYRGSEARRSAPAGGRIPRSPSAALTRSKPDPGTDSGAGVKLARELAEKFRLPGSGGRR